MFPSLSIALPLADLPIPNSSMSIILLSRCFYGVWREEERNIYVFLLLAKKFIERKEVHAPTYYCIAKAHTFKT